MKEGGRNEYNPMKFRKNWKFEISVCVNRWCNKLKVKWVEVSENLI